MPIKPGKLEEWKSLTQQVTGEKKTDYIVSRKRAGISRESAFHQKTPMGDFVVVVVEPSRDGGAALGKIFERKDTFDQWFARRAEEIHGVTSADMARMPPNTLHLDWRG